MQLELKQLQVPPGRVLEIKDISWQGFEGILEGLGESSSKRISYSNGMLEITSPLFEHEDDKGIISDLVKVLLEELDIEFRDAGSTTLKNEEMGRAVEPDSSFYIANEGAVRGKKRIDLTTDPPPDLAIEIDITSRTKLKNYEALGVSEVWGYDGGDRLQINVLEEGEYVESEVSYNFRNLPELKGAIASHLQGSKVIGRNATMRAFRNWVKEQLIINN